MTANRISLRGQIKHWLFIGRRKNKRGKHYDLGGVVLIDEIETHLHLALQLKIMPILIHLFPNIQFIVTTHSPFKRSYIRNNEKYAELQEYVEL